LYILTLSKKLCQRGIQKPRLVGDNCPQGVVVGEKA
jgi:hypothetical protein